MIYPIVAYGNPVLKQRANDIEQGTDLKQLVEDMFETMHNAYGIGLAAPQIGKSIRLFVVDGSPLEEEELEDFTKVFINPKIVQSSNETEHMEEGCLSIPDIREEVKRPFGISIQYYDLDWNYKEEKYEGMAARIIQHEYDHIEGVLFTDYLSTLKKKLLKRRLNNISKGTIKADYPMSFPSISKKRS